ncbi:alanine racemase [Virgibacillus natechei]|uniref:Alanine racemase n=1 Tax=Virgibacillus natechei TaxID=1216297 RepID=A0ABS4IHQ0_9BACI|nr:alanine racemase [Virgibacillus natechei]MBP1970100.1 alanine racemase [Virgibacillus natechei]UZD14179.1 alanine racemase [Virgibacillus natechei]
MLQTPTLSAYHPTTAEIDLAAFNENITKLKKLVKKSMLLAVIKTNAYGHGTVRIGEEAVKAGAESLGVTTVEEGALLRENGIDVPIHILSSITPEQASDVVRYELTASVFSIRLAKAISEVAVKQRKTIPVHLKLDTGLHRFGLEPHEVLSFCEVCYELPGLWWEGVYTHFSSVDEGDWETTERQFNLFIDTVTMLDEQGFNFAIRHVGGSTIAIERPDMHLDMVRPGVALFGYQPAARQRDIISLKPVMALKSNLIYVRELPPNTPVGYGGSYVTRTTKKIAVVPIGHGDGYSRALSNKGKMLIGGKRVKIIGTISLDQTLVDVTDVPDVTEGEEVILLGEQGGDEITAEDVADWMGSIVDEVVSGFTERIRRVYV